MTPTGPLNGLPIACTLTVGAGREEVERWRAFDVDQPDVLLVVTGTPEQLTALSVGNG